MPLPLDGSQAWWRFIAADGKHFFVGTNIPHCHLATKYITASKLQLFICKATDFVVVLRHIHSAGRWKHLLSAFLHSLGNFHLPGHFFCSMAKRFIDTDLFKDGWFESLSNDAKVFWLYYITNCDHAGLLKYTKRQIAFYCNLSSVDAVFSEFGERLVHVKEDLLWMPKFFRYQYGNWPENNFAAANSAYYSLTKLPIDLDSHITVPRELKDSLSKGIGIGKSKGDSKGKKESESQKIEKALEKF